MSEVVMAHGAESWPWDGGMLDQPADHIELRTMLVAAIAERQKRK